MTRRLACLRAVVRYANCVLAISTLAGVRLVASQLHRAIATIQAGTAKTYGIDPMIAETAMKNGGALKTAPTTCPINPRLTDTAKMTATAMHHPNAAIYCMISPALLASSGVVFARFAVVGSSEPDTTRQITPISARLLSSCAVRRPCLRPVAR